MDYGASDSSGTDDDLPPSHQNRDARGRITANGRTVVGAPAYPRVQNDMETQIHRLEQEAYSSVLRAFKAQSDAITWEKEGLITELRKELRVSDEEHRELLSRVNADDIILRIREWRQEGGLHSGLLNKGQPVHDPATSPTVSASRKRPKTSLSLGAPSPALQSQGVSTSMQPTSGKPGVALGAKSKKPKSGHVLPVALSTKSLQYPSTAPNGRCQITNRGSGALAGNEPVENAAYDPLIGRKVMTRWPEDNSFYNAVITDYNPQKGLHALVYDINTKNETWEWVNLKEISPEDIRWEGEDPGLHQGDLEPGLGVKKSVGRGGALPGAGRGRGPLKIQPNKDFIASQNGIGKIQPNKDFIASQNGIGKNGSNDIKILHTESLMKEVERVIGSSHPDPLEMEKMKKLLKEHEQSLIESIASIADASDGESAEEDEGQFSHPERGWKNREYMEQAWA